MRVLQRQRAESGVIGADTVAAAATGAAVTAAVTTAADAPTCAVQAVTVPVTKLMQQQSPMQHRMLMSMPPPMPMPSMGLVPPRMSPMMQY
mmetsp:Transcript_25339/g.54760  ORF Transcript_25339/g.54760 Transcript_25339/m.54760 type:complete len:91 (+) Transcript_25339:480-752(+)